MGCETDLLSEEPEIERSPINTAAEREYPRSVTIYNRLETATIHFRNNSSYAEDSEMATGCAVDVDKSQTESNEELNIENTIAVENHTDRENSKVITKGGDSIDCKDNSVLEKVLIDLDKLKDLLTTATDIPPILLDVSLNCLKPSTIDYISYHLDPESEVLSPEGKLKDYRGLAEWIGLEPIFIKYISRSSHMLKTKEVISKWLTLEEEPLPILKNLRECLLAIDRPDVLEDMSVKMGLDAVKWKKTQIEAKTKREVPTEDKSWQLTRHDVVSGSTTNYTCCLIYADEDEGMVQIFTKLYKTVYPKALFFLPQFDLKQGKFIFDTTAQVIEERCGGKVIFFLSEYFFASPVCRFTVGFCKDMDGLVSGKKTMYTACLLYADEDELMAQLITKLYKDAYKDSLFFLPQFDLKHGKYELDTTARVIDERCDKKVIFLLSEYFYASNICQFAVNYTAAHGTGNGNLIPFHLTRNVTTVPNVLKGIAGIRWFRKATRQHTWQILADCLLAEKIQSEELLRDIKERIEKMVAKDPEYYLQDPQYDEDIAPPGDPIEVVEPAGSSSMPSSADIEMQRQKIEEEMQRNKKKESKSKRSLIKQIKKAIFEKIFPQSVGSHHSEIKTSSSSSSSPSTLPSSTLPSSSLVSPSSTSSKALVLTFKASPRTDIVRFTNKEARAEWSDVNTNSRTETYGSELGACGGSEDNLTQNDLNLNSDSKPSEHDKDDFNICESESLVLHAKTKYRREGKISTSATINADGVCSNDKPTEDFLICNKNNSENNCAKNRSDISCKPRASYEMKVIKNNANVCESEPLINKDDGDKNGKVKCDDTAGNLKETNASMSDYNET